MKQINTNSQPKISELDPRAIVRMVATGELVGLDGLADRGLPREGILGRMGRNDTVRWSRPRDAGAPLRRCATRRVQGPAEGPAAAKRDPTRAASAIATGRWARG